jgi:hypothetical protein
MELQVRIASQGNLEEREFTNNETGQKEKFATMPFVLQHGSDRIYCEMVQEQARKQAALDPNYYYVASIAMQARPWTDQQGRSRYENRITLNKICLL